MDRDTPETRVPPRFCAFHSAPARRAASWLESWTLGCCDSGLGRHMSRRTTRAEAGLTLSDARSQATAASLGRGGVVAACRLRTSLTLTRRDEIHRSPIVNVRM